MADESGSVSTSKTPSSHSDIIYYVTIIIFYYFIVSSSDLRLLSFVLSFIHYGDRFVTRTLDRIVTASHEWYITTLG